MEATLALCYTLYRYDLRTRPISSNAQTLLVAAGTRSIFSRPDR